jgi:hypothetical protein
MHYFSTLFGKELYMFRTDFLSIIRSLNTLFTAIHASSIDCWRGQVRSGHPDLTWPRQQTVNITSMTNTSCCEYSIETADGQ